MPGLLCVGDLWDRELILDSGSVLYDKARGLSNRGTEFTVVAADIMTTFAYINSLCSRLGPISSADPFTCPREQYELSMSLLAVIDNFNSLQLWTNRIETHGEKVIVLVELWVLHSVVRRAAGILSRSVVITKCDR